jgi:IclR family acetate operon transcriptional repressor
MRKQVPLVESSVGTLARGLDILGLFAADGPELSQREISATLGLPGPTVHRLCAVLAERGYLERDPGSRRYSLGMEVARLVPPLMAGLRLPELARGALRRLAEATAETANLAVLEGGEAVYLASETGSRLLTPYAPVGLRLPVHCTALGKCLLAQLPDAAARSAAGPEPYERRTPATLVRWPALHAALEAARRDGLATSDGEYEPGLASFAVPVAWPGGPAAINLSLPSARADAAFREQQLPALLEAARSIAAGAALHAGN